MNVLKALMSSGCTVSISDPYHTSNTKLLLNFNGVDDGTSFTDSGPIGKTASLVNTPVTKTGTKKYGSASCLFVGTDDDGLTFPDSTDWVFGTGDYTIECWCYFNSMKNCVISTTNYSAGFAVVVGSAGAVGMYHNGTLHITASGAVSTGAWKHIALSRSSGTLRIFVDGTQVGSSFSASENISGSATLYVGKASGNSLEGIDCYMDDFRITKGVARYTSNFTPPTTELPGYTTCPSAPYMVATGGTVTTDGNYKVHTFTSVGTSTFTVTSVGSDVTYGDKVEVLIVAGGGGGATTVNGGRCAGGGAGGLLYYGAESPKTPNGSAITVSATSYSITVGDGGSVCSSAGTGDGGNSSAFGYTATGGGGGGYNDGVAGHNGGSAGGGWYTSAGGTGTSGQGSNGGNGQASPDYGGGGGGGAGQVGEAGLTTRGGNGGNGLQYSISGSATYYAGGGAGSTWAGTSTNVSGTAGLGGGGTGGNGYGSVYGTNGTNGRGGGGGAGDATGGSGVVIVRYRFQ